MDVTQRHWYESWHTFRNASVLGPLAIDQRSFFLGFPKMYSLLVLGPDLWEGVFSFIWEKSRKCRKVGSWVVPDLQEHVALSLIHI